MTILESAVERLPPPPPAIAGAPAQAAPAPGVTQWLRRLRGGEPGALESLVPLLYDEMRRVASGRMRGERDGHTLGTTALVHETYLRLLRQRRIDAADREGFLAVAANTMRRVLVDYARGRRRRKRGGEQSPLRLDALPAGVAEPLLADDEAEEMLLLDDALERLARIHPRGARVIEVRFFGGLTLDQTASLLGVSSKTVQREWLTARTWLRKEVFRGLMAGDPS
jgi:RNA polymerase sigma factor (TIGR02999 family)